jgi:hypothetical protein
VLDRFGGNDNHIVFSSHSTAKDRLRVSSGANKAANQAKGITEKAYVDGRTIGPNDFGTLVGFYAQLPSAIIFARASAVVDFVSDVRVSHGGYRSCRLR